MINVSELLADPDFIEPCILVRSVMVRDEYGRIRATAEEKEILACVQPSGGQELETLRDLLAADIKDLITVYSTEQITAGTDKTLPDRIKYRGQLFEVLAAEDFFWCGGYVKATARLVKNDNEPT